MTTQQSAMQMTGTVVASRVREYSMFVCPIAALHVGAPAGSWSTNDLTTRKPGLSRLTSELAP
ncbi:MAG TPA: hypothetical protein VGO03_16785 [Acidimicrobiia bacterium]|jgi:hypothetical protein